MEVDEEKRRKYDIDAEKNRPQFVYGTPDYMRNNDKYNIKPEDNVPQKVYGVYNPQKNLEETVKAKVKDPFWVSLIVKYFKEEEKMNDYPAMLLFNDLAKYEDILNEFTKYLIKRTYDLDNAIEINGYTAKKIHELNSTFSPVGVYTFMKLLKTDSKKAEEIIASGFKNKDGFN